MTTIYRAVHQDTQSVLYEHICSEDVSSNRIKAAGERPLKFRIVICRNDYDESYARGYVYSPIKMEWSLIVDLPITDCSFNDITDDDYKLFDFEQDDGRIARMLWGVCA